MEKSLSEILQELKAKRREGVENSELEMDIARTRRAIFSERELRSAIPGGPVKIEPGVQQDAEEWRVEQRIALGKLTAGLDVPTHAEVAAVNPFAEMDPAEWNRRFISAGPLKVETE